MIKKKVNYWSEFVMIFSNKPSLFSSKKIERFFAFFSLLIFTIIYLFRNITDITITELMEITSLWLAYGGYNSYMNYRDKKIEGQNSSKGDDLPDTEENIK